MFLSLIISIYLRLVQPRMRRQKHSPSVGFYCVSLCRLRSHHCDEPGRMVIVSKFARLLETIEACRADIASMIAFTQHSAAFANAVNETVPNCRDDQRYTRLPGMTPYDDLLEDDLAMNLTMISEFPQCEPLYA